MACAERPAFGTLPAAMSGSYARGASKMARQRPHPFAVEQGL
ncbi:MAG: hypothetical protein QOE57_1739 [Acidimicrobiaceae bacterium]|jgi:hypothetical protein|nr:hypothetical protein [Acidimicrobiaceae bacterium]